MIIYDSYYHSPFDWTNRGCCRYHSTYHRLREINASKLSWITLYILYTSHEFCFRRISPIKKSTSCSVIPRWGWLIPCINGSEKIPIPGYQSLTTKVGWCSKSTNPYKSTLFLQWERKKSPFNQRHAAPRTCEPKRAMACASSLPMGPPPMTARLDGKTSRSKMDS